MPKHRSEYQYRVNATGITIPAADTTAYFDVAYLETVESPIDKFFIKIRDLNLLNTKIDSVTMFTADLKKTQNNLILLGYVSASESYFRELIRQLIVIDRRSRLASENQMLTFGAAIHYSKELLPEALLENCSFASKKNIIDAFKDFLGLKGHTPQEVEKVLSEFEKICQLRHCIVHRFGKLGSNNAIKFGLESHLDCLEKPLVLNINQLYQVYQICENTILVINDHLYKRIMIRTLEPDISDWSWDLRKDKNKFEKYYSLFASLQKPPMPVSSATEAYNKLREYKNSL